MQTDGWVKAYRKMIENPVVWKSPTHISVWMYLLLNATHESNQVMFGGKKITLLPGQLLTSYQKIADSIKDKKINVQRAIIDMRNDTQIDTRTDRQQSLIIIRNWDVYQGVIDTRNDTQIDTRTIHEPRKGKKKTKKGFSPHPFSKKENRKSPKETYKNERSVCSAGAHTHEDTHTDLVTVGKYGNVSVPSAWLSDFKAKYTYADDVIESLSRYKASKCIENENDVPYLEHFAESDREKRERSFTRKNAAFWQDPTHTEEYWEDFFNRNLERSKRK